MADKESTERRVYVLPIEQLERIRAYQVGNSITSEVEAVRRLLDSALQMRDSVQDILKKLKSRYADEKDLRVLAKDILTGHALVRSVHFSDDGVWFYLADDCRGQIIKNGKTYEGEGPIDEGWNEYPAPQPPPARSQGGYAPRASARGVSGGPSWDAPKGGDLDDEIPF